MKSPSKKEQKKKENTRDDDSLEETTEYSIVIKDEKKEIYFTTKDFIQIYNALSRGLITQEIIDDIINEFLNNSSFAQVFNYNFEAGLNHFSLMFKILSADIDHKCADMINERVEHINLFRDNFIESIPKDKTFRQVDVLKYKVITKGTLNTHEENFKTKDSSSYNISKFAEWMKNWNYDKYLVFKSKYIEDLKNKS